MCRVYWVCNWLDCGKDDVTTISKDEVVRLAREAKIIPTLIGGGTAGYFAHIKAFAELARADLVAETDQLRSEVERVRRETVEECAKVCYTIKETVWDHSSPPGQYETTASQAVECAKKIKELLK